MLSSGVSYIVSIWEIMREKFHSAKDACLLKVAHVLFFGFMPEGFHCHGQNSIKYLQI